MLQLSLCPKETCWQLSPGSQDLNPTSLIKCSPAALQPALCTCLSPTQPTGPCPYPRLLGAVCCAARPRVQSPGWNVALPLPSNYPQFRPKSRALERSEHLSAICSGLGPEQLAFLQERKGGAQLCWVSKGLFLCSPVSRPGLGSRLERQSARWAVTAQTGVGLLPDKPQPSGQGACSLWGVWSCALLRPFPYYPPS